MTTNTRWKVGWIKKGRGKINFFPSKKRPSQLNLSFPLILSHSLLLRSHSTAKEEEKTAHPYVESTRKKTTRINCTLNVSVNSFFNIHFFHLSSLTRLLLISIFLIIFYFLCVSKNYCYYFLLLLGRYHTNTHTHAIISFVLSFSRTARKSVLKKYKLIQFLVCCVCFFTPLLFARLKRNFVYLTSKNYFLSLSFSLCLIHL